MLFYNFTEKTWLSFSFTRVDKKSVFSVFIGKVCFYVFIPFLNIWKAVNGFLHIFKAVGVPVFFVNIRITFTGWIPCDFFIVKIVNTRSFPKNRFINNLAGHADSRAVWGYHNIWNKWPCADNAARADFCTLADKYLLPYPNVVADICAEAWVGSFLCGGVIN